MTLRALQSDGIYAEMSPDQEASVRALAAARSPTVFLKNENGDDYVMTAKEVADLDAARASITIASWPISTTLIVRRLNAAGLLSVANSALEANVMLKAESTRSGRYRQTMLMLLTFAGHRR
jgi:hypothetical protein